MNEITNSLMQITTYKLNNSWVFDDDDRGLVKEPFVAGADELLDMIAGKNKTVNLTIASDLFPGVTHIIDRVNKSGAGLGGGTDYVYLYNDGKTNNVNQLPVWLCPALFKFFDKAPKSIYIKANVDQKSKLSRWYDNLFTS
tara:strand:- start:245 stop:667 length:423 start_codon:yes stop_codon:yes gene_type:complete